VDSNVLGGVKQILEPHNFRGVGEFVLDEEFPAVPSDKRCWFNWLECLSSQCTTSKPHDLRSVC